MGCQFFIMDVFCERPFAGNPLAVVRDCTHLDAIQMQSIAREFNFSETVFVLPPRDPVNSAQVRIFTPSQEIPFAGHPTIGTAVLIAQQDAPEMLSERELIIVLEEEVGLLQCSVRKRKDRAVRAVFTVPGLPEKRDAPSAEAAANALGLDISDIGFDEHEVSVFSAGNSFVYVPVGSRNIAERASPRPDSWGSLMSGSGAIGAFVYTKDCTLDGAHVHARMFAPDYGVPEDPATGSAAAGFAGVCLDYEKPGDGEHQIIIEQGIEMNRPSEIALTMKVVNDQLNSVTVGGSAVLVGGGTLEI